MCQNQVTYLDGLERDILAEQSIGKQGKNNDKGCARGTALVPKRGQSGLRIYIGLNNVEVDFARQAVDIGERGGR